ncbi:MAG: hypothetical protein QOE51_5063 [Actinoplanes sp.]|nr:hypothetical protein [Actinoplanes sp.]
MPSLFRRKSADLVADATDSVTTESQPASRPKNYTPSKKELGVATPKRTSAGRRIAEPAPENRRAAYKQMRARQKVERGEASAGMRAGDPRYLLARDRGPERELVRNIVDSRRTVGTWFFGGAVIVLIGSSTKMPVQVQLFANLLWAALAIAVIVDSFLIARRVKKLVTERFPKTTLRRGSLYLYAIMRGLSFRRMRVPKPAVALGTKI